MKNKLFKKVLAIVVTLALVAQMFTFASFAAEPFEDNRVVDASTMTDWQKYFGESVLNTENAGGVWGDKSVFKSVNEFKFNLKAEDGAVLQTKEVKDGTFTFDALEFTKAGSYIYTVEEVALDDETITYDNAVFTVKVVVTDDGKATLSKQVTILNGNNNAESIKFNNLYTTPIPEPTPTPNPNPNPNPITGDFTNIFAWFAVAFISGGLLLATGFMGKKKQEAE